MQSIVHDNRFARKSCNLLFERESDLVNKNIKHITPLEHITKNAAQKLEIPKDTVLGAAIVKVTGQSEVYIENYKGIVSYTSKEIIIKTKTCMLEITGINLFVDYYTNEDMKISGEISQINYHN